jgi:TolA-binding protein
MFPRLSLCLFVALPLLAADKPNRDIQDLQRDVAQLQELVKNLQHSLDERFTALQTQVQRSVDATAAVSAVQRTVEQMAKDQQTNLLPTVNGLNTRMDGVSGDLRTTQQAVGDLANLMSKLQTQIVDLSNAVKVLSQPAAAPPQISATDLITNAERDYTGGKLDLALQEYSDYLKLYGETARAGEAQYAVAWIYYSREDFGTASKEFDTVIQKYPESSKLPEAFFYKGDSLKRVGHTKEANEAFRELRQRFPNHELAKKTLSPRK